MSMIAYKIISVFFVFSVVIFIHEFGHFIMAKMMGVRVERFSFGFGRRILGRKIGSTDYWISAIPVGGYIKMAGETPEETLTGAPDEYLSQPISKRLCIIVTGPLLNYLSAFLIFFFIFFIAGTPRLTSEIGELIEDFPATSAGLKIGDRIVTIDGEPIRRWDEMSRIIHQKTEGSLTLTVERQNREFQITLSPKVEKVKNILGEETEIGLIGIAPVIVKYSPGKSVYAAGTRLFTLTAQTYKGIWLLVTGRLQARKALAGPIGIFVITAQMAELGTVSLFHWMAFISAILAIFNLLPIPVLDGGHVIFLTIEKLRGRPLSVKTQGNIQQIAICLLITLMVFVSYNDIINFRIVEKIVSWWQGR